MHTIKVFYLFIHILGLSTSLRNWQNKFLDLKVPFPIGSKYFTIERNGSELWEGKGDERWRDILFMSLWLLYLSGVELLILHMDCHGRIRTHTSHTDWQLFGPLSRYGLTI